MTTNKILCLILILLVGCKAPDTRVPTEPVPAAKEQPSAAPSLDSALDLHGKADGQAAVTAAKVTSLSTQLDKVHREATSAVAELDRLRKAKFAVEEDLVAFYNRLIEQEKAMKAMALQVTDVEASLVAERKLREEEASKLHEAERLLRAKEQEAAMLRSQLGLANAHAREAEQAIKTANGLNERLNTEVNRLKGESSFKTKLLIGAAVLVLFLVGAILLLLKFRSVLPF